MQDDEEQVLSGIDTMMNALPAGGSWRLNMISVTPQQAVVSTEFPLVPGDDAGDALVMYQSLPESVSEQGFLALHDYMELNPYSATWMRPSAALLVVFVSDEEEQSTNFFPDALDFVTWYERQRANVFLASIIHDTPGPGYTSGCYYSVRDFGERYLRHEPSWRGRSRYLHHGLAMGVQEASSSIQPLERWELTHEPLDTTIVVFVDGVLFSDWLYNPVDNAVEFLTLPPGGSLVEIGYTY